MSYLVHLLDPSVDLTVCGNYTGPLVSTDTWTMNFEKVTCPLCIADTVAKRMTLEERQPAGKSEMTESIIELMRLQLKPTWIGGVT